MKASKKAKRFRSFSDIHHIKNAENVFGRVYDFTVNLKPSFYVKHRIEVLIGAALIVVAAAFATDKIITKAEVADFYPSTCLGTWQNPSNAQGHPETEGSSTSSLFAESNSAVYKFSGTAQGDQTIFCGSFVPPDFEQKGDIKNVSLTLVWRVGSDANAQQQSIPAEAPADIQATGTSAENSSSGQVMEPGPISSSTQSAPANSSGTSSSSTTSFLFDVFGLSKTVFAQEVSSTPSAPIPVSSPADNSAGSTATTSSAIPAAAANNAATTTTADSTNAAAATTTPASAPVIAATATATGTAATNAGATTTTGTIPLAGASSSDSAGNVSSSSSVLNMDTANIFTVFTKDDSSGTASSAVSSSSADAVQSSKGDNPVQDDSFADINYSTDGQNWVELKKVNMENWRDLNLVIPLSKWDDIKKLQVQVKIIPTSLNPFPDIYLDGMLLEVNYDLPPIFASVTNIEPEQPRIIQVNPNATIENPLPEKLPIVPAPTIVSITKAAGTVHVKIQYVGDFYGGNSFNVFMYPASTTAQRNGSDNGFSFTEAPTGPFMDSAQLFKKDFNPSTMQAEFDIVAPDADPNYGIKTSNMISGKYAVDASYYDSEKWNLIPAQIFDWP